MGERTEGGGTTRRGGGVAGVAAVLAPTVVVGIGQGPALAGRQDAAAVAGTPPAGAFVPGPDEAVPPPEACQVAPRPLPLVAEAAGTPSVSSDPVATAAPFAPPVGEPADEATGAGVVATIQESIACRNAGDFRRAYALFSDAMLVRLFGRPDTIDPEIVAALEVGPDAVRRGQQLGLGSVSEVRVLADGRVGAEVTTRHARDGAEAGYRDYPILVRAGDRWLIDEAIALPS